MPGPEPLAILFEDAHLLAVNKPSGLLTQGFASGAPTLEAAVRAHLSPARSGGEAPYVGTVHRLDRPVSGVVLWAKTPKAARRLAEQFARREADKLYWAVVGADAARAGIDPVWDDWLSPVEQGRARVVAPSSAGARRAVTRVEVGGAERWPGDFVRLVLRPETGRTHQLRAQAASRGLPIVGDAAYGSPVAFAPGIALHARSLTVRHPVLRHALTFVAPAPGSWDGRGLVPAGPG